jgi:hypothetical protein
MSDAHNDASRGEGEAVEILVDSAAPKELAGDIRLLSRAVSERWPIDPAKRAAMVNRLCRIVDKDAVTTIDKDGREVHDEEKADRNAIAASRVLVQMIGQNQRDEAPRQSMAPVVNVGVAVNGNPQSGRNLATQIAQRIRLARLSGDAPG